MIFKTKNLLDVTEYYIYPEIIEEIQTLKHKIIQFVSIWTNDYLWNEEGFNLKIVLKDGIKCIFGSTIFGENIRDEWFITWLLFEISKKFSVICSINDSDGEFLLIIAASYLPNWVNPNTISNRIFIKKGKLHLIPYGFSIRKIKLGLQTVWNISIKTECSASIQRCIIRQLNNFIGIFNENQSYSYHYTNVVLPLTISKILNLVPLLIKKTIDRFFNQDILSIETKTKTKLFPIKDIIHTRIRFTRYLFSKIINQSSNCSKYLHLEGYEQEKDFRTLAFNLGMKIFSGMKMLFKTNNFKRNLKNTCIMDEICKRTNQHWQIYVNKLQNNNFYMGYLEYSEAWTKLHYQAKNMYYQTWLNEENNKNNVLRCLFKKLINFDVKKDEFTHFSLLPSNDNLKWMNISEQDLLKMMMPFQKNLFKTKNQNGSKILNLMISIKDLIKKSSGLEGVDLRNEWVDDLFKDQLNPLFLNLMNSMDKELKDVKLCNNLIDENLNLSVNFLTTLDNYEGRVGPFLTMLNSLNVN